MSAATLQRRCFALDLKDDAAVIERYKHWHRPGAPPAEVTRSLRAAGIAALDIYLIGNRLFMIMDSDPHRSVQREVHGRQRRPARAGLGSAHGRAAAGAAVSEEGSQRRKVAAPRTHLQPGGTTMKLLRYGPVGHEKPGVLDAAGTSAT